MKYGIHLSTYTKTWGEDLIPWIRKSAEIGYDGVELPLMNPFEFPVENVKSVLQETGLECTCGTGLSETIDISSIDADVQSAGIGHLRKCIDICKELGSHSLGGVIYAPWGYTGSREENRERFLNSAKNMHRIAEYAASCDVALNIEMINRYESSMINTVEDGLAYLKLVDHPNVKLHFDTYHASIEEKSMYKALCSGKGKIGHVHIAENDRGIPGTGQIDWDAFKKGIQAIEYNDWLVVECFVTPESEAGTGSYTWRNIETDPVTVAKEALVFLKKNFGDSNGLSADQCKELLLNIADMFIERQNELASYDAVIGDGDHGITMARGAKAARLKIEEMDDGTARDYFKLYGRTLISVLGGAMGPLFGSIFLEISKECIDKEVLGLQELSTGLEHGMEKVMDLGGAKPGDKTMVDSIDETVKSLKRSCQEGCSLKDAINSAADAAMEGVHKTIPMIAKRGRSRYLQEKAIGHQDAGATSFAYMICTIRDYINKEVA